MRAGAEGGGAGGGGRGSFFGTARWRVLGGPCGDPYSSNDGEFQPSTFCHVQRSPLFCANIVKKDPGKARQNSLATAGTNFTKPGAQNKGDLCTLKVILPYKTVTL